MLNKFTKHDKLSEDAIQIAHRIAGAKDLLKLHREELATCRAMVTDVVVTEETAPWKAAMIETCDAQLAQIEAALSALDPKRSRELYVCEECGSSDVEVLNWCDANSDKVTDAAHGDDDVYCNACEDHTGIVPRSEYVEEAEARHLARAEELDRDRSERDE